MTAPVFVLGGAQTDFATTYGRKGEGVFEILRDAVRGALDATRLDAGAIDAAHVGNFTAELFAHQGQLGGFFPSIDPGFEGKPSARHEAACASGSIALLAATAEIEAGRHDVVCVAGVEQMRNVAGDEAARHLGVAAWSGREAKEARYLWPWMFSRVADVYAERFGLDARHLGQIAKKAFQNAKGNPLAQTRGWSFTDDSFTTNDAANPVVEGRIRRQDCGQITDGAAALVLASARYTERYAKDRGLDLARIPRILGWGHRTAPMLLEDKLLASAAQGPGEKHGLLFPHLAGVLEDARKRAGLASVRDVDLLEVHDCFTVTEYTVCDHLGIHPPGEAWRGIEEGTLERGGALPINPSGGLVGVGHPVGATGVRMLLDASRQVRGDAGGTQVEGAKRAQTLNLGGSATTLVSFVVGV